MSRWLLSSSSDARALAIVDGLGPFAEYGPHYSRRTPGSKTFTGVGREIVLVTDCGRAVWACVYQRTPSAPGTGSSRGRTGVPDARPRHLWRNMVFRNLGAGLSSTLIRDATARTYEEWIKRYGTLPPERLRTEIGVREVRSKNPGACYQLAGWERGEIKRGPDGTTGVVHRRTVTSGAAPPPSVTVPPLLRSAFRASSSVRLNAPRFAFKKSSSVPDHSTSPVSASSIWMVGLFRFALATCTSVPQRAGGRERGAGPGQVGGDAGVGSFHGHPIGLERGRLEAHRAGW